MSQENVEVVQELYGAIGKGDVEAALRLVLPNGEWVNPDDAMEPGIRRGLSGMRTALTAIRDSFAELCFDLSEVVDLGERVLVTGTFSGVGRTSHAAFGPQVFGSVVTLTDGKVQRYEWYLSREDALEAAGLSE